MTGLRDFHTSIFDFATKVMTAVEGQRGDSSRSSQVTATIVFAGIDVNRKFSISRDTGQTTSPRRCVVVRERKDTTEDSENLADQDDGGGRSPP